MSKYDFDLDLNVRNSLSLIIKRIRPNSQVLEFGPANGRMTKYLQQELGCSVYAVELDKEAAKDAGKYCEEIIVGNIEDYEWLERYQKIKFDYIVFADVLEHLYNPQRVLERAKQLLHKQGSILFSIPNIAHNAIIMELLDNRFTYHPVGLLDDTHIRFFTKTSLDELVAKIGMFKTYETAVFVSPEHTEFHKFYESFPTEVSSFLKQRALGEAYQYVYELKLQKQKLESDLHLHKEFKLFYDNGSGFSEEHIVVTEFENNKAVFDLSGVNKRIKRIRIDPLEKAVKFQLESLKVDGVEYKDKVQHNGIFKEGFWEFYHLDPQIVVDFDTAGEINSVEVILKNFEEISDYLYKLIDTKNKEIFEKDKQLKKFSMELQSIKQLIKKKEQLIKEKEQQIQKKEQQIKHLYDIAQSMRIKNRLKRIVPVKLFNMIKTVKNNPLIFKKVFYYLKRGEFSYLFSKVKQKSQINLSSVSELTIIEPSKYFKKFKISDYQLGNITIDIIIPVYNGYEYLEALFDSLEKNTSSSHRLIVVNDCSSDKRVKPYLDRRLQYHQNAIIIENETNLGFVKSVNKAVAYVKNHFVILNTDTEVPKFWLERLMYPIIKMENIASTTPFTNAGTIASFPLFLEDNKIFNNMGVNELDEVFSKIYANNFYTELPTGVGFCMGVNYNLVKEIGFFDEETFTRGYGEENDWCQRAIKAKYKNILVPNLFVYHKHGGSFPSKEKQTLISENYMKLLKKHPNYDRDVQEYIKRDPHKTLRELLILVASSKKVALHLIFDHNIGGGANVYAKELIEKYEKEQKNILYIRFDFYAGKYILSHFFQSYRSNFAVSTFEDLKKLLEQLNFQEIFLNNLVSYKDIFSLLDYISILVIKDSTIRLIIPIHDFYCICPSYTLINNENNYCNVPSLDTCQKCMQTNNSEWKSFYSDKIDMERWRKKWLVLLENSFSILCFSSSSKSILLKAYPSLDESLIQVIPHVVPPLPPVEQKYKNDGQKITLGVLGAINYSKGSSIVKNLVKRIENENLDINIVLIGEISEQINSDHLHITGRYKREDLPKIINKHKIDIFFIPSIWPETFSYTTQEIMMMQMPLMVFDLGAPAERVKSYEKGFIIKNISVDDVIKTLHSIKKRL